MNGELKVGACASLQSYILRLLTALGGQLLVEFWELRLHRNADGAAQKMGPPRHGTPLLQKRGAGLPRRRDTNETANELNGSNKSSNATRRAWKENGGREGVCVNAEVTHSPYL